jgi:hypothetical protein
VTSSPLPSPVPRNNSLVLYLATNSGVLLKAQPSQVRLFAVPVAVLPQESGPSVVRALFIGLIRTGGKVRRAFPEVVRTKGRGRRSVGVLRGGDRTLIISSIREFHYGGCEKSRLFQRSWTLSGC